MSTATSTVTILSAKGGKYEAPDELHGVVLFTSEGLLVDAARQFEPLVQDYLSKLRAKGVQVVPTRATPQRIADLLKVGMVPRAEKIGTEDISSQQAAVIARVREAQSMDASDVHLVCNDRAGTARFLYRINGDLIDAPRGAMTYEEGKSFTQALYNTMTDVAQQYLNLNKPQDARFRPEVLVSSGIYGARVATRPTDSGFLMVLRILRAADSDLGLDGLGYLDRQIADLVTIMDHSYGLCLISGPTGSGKSRTLQVMLSLVVKRTAGREHIITFEQPCEYEIPGANQTPVELLKDATGRQYADFAGAIKNAMRLDPDVIMLGEVRDHESAVAVVEAAQTGHMVYSTVHANGAFEIPARLIGEPIALPRERVLDPTVIKGMVGQRLVQLLCPDCKRPLHADKEKLKSGLYERLTAVLAPSALANVHVRGDDPDCRTCGGLGITSRQVVAEVVRTNLALISTFERDGHVAARKEWIERGEGVSMKMHALLLVAQGRVDPADAESSVDLLDDEVSGLGICYPPTLEGMQLFRPHPLRAVLGSSAA